MTGLINWLKTLLPKGKFARSVIVLAGGTALGQGLVVLASPLVTRLYTPESFGILAVYTSILGIVSVVASLRYEMSLPLPENDEAAANLLALCLSIVLGISLLTLLGVWLLNDRIVVWTNVTALHQYLWLLPLSVLGIGYYQVFNYWAVRKRAFSHIASTKFNQSLVLVVTQVSFGFLSFGAVGLLLGQLLGYIAGTTTLASMTWLNSQEVLRKISVIKIFQVAIRYGRFPIFSSTSALLDSLGSQLPFLLLAALYGAPVAGLFALGQRVVGLPAGLVGISVAQVYMSESARIAQENSEKLMSLFWTTVKGQLVIGLPLITLLALPALWTFPLVFGTAWRQAGLYVQVLSPMFVLAFVSNPVGVTLDVLERQDLHMLRETASICLVIGAIVLSRMFYKEPLPAIIFLGIANSIYYVFGLLLVWYSIKTRKVV